MRILILRSSYEDQIKKGNKFPFRPGMTASVEIITSKKDNVLSVPLAAVTTRNPDEKKNGGDMDKRDDDDKRTVTSAKDKAPTKKEDKVVVFINDKGIAKMLEVKTGISDYDNIEILTGISDSVEVITGPFLVVSKRLKNGDKVKLAKKDDKKDKTADSK